MLKKLSELSTPVPTNRLDDMPYYKDGDAILRIVKVFSGDQETIGESEVQALKPHVYPMADGSHAYVPAMQHCAI